MTKEVFNKYIKVLNETINEMTAEDIIKRLEEFKKYDEDIKNGKYRLIFNNKKED